MFLLNRLQILRIESQSFEYGRRDLGSLDWTGHRERCQRRIRQQHHYVRVVMGETAMFRELLAAARIDHPDIRSNYYIRCPRIPVWRQAGKIVHQANRGSPEDLADAR